jgi:hypothetical protein
MDPWLQHWESVHGALVHESVGGLNDVLAPGLVARSQQRVIIEAQDVSLRQSIPGVLVVERQGAVTKYVDSGS